MQVPAVRERAALDDARRVDPMEEEPGPWLRPLRLVHGSERARGTDHQSGALPRDTSHTDVRACAVEERRIPALEGRVRDLEQALGVEAERLEQFLVPRPRSQIDESRRR